MLDRVYYDNFGINVCNTHRINTILEEEKSGKKRTNICGLCEI